VLPPPPFGTTSVYWSPSVEPGGTVTRSLAADAGKTNAASTPKIATTFNRCTERPAFTSLAYPGSELH
jgi:hypothetical protein